MSSYQKYYDTHTLFIKCDCASAQQIRATFGEALTMYQTATGKRLECRYRVNLLIDREGNSFGIAFVFVTNPAVYYMLLGKNPDGSDRIEYMDDPAWEPPADGELTNDSGWSSISEPVITTGMSWADISDEEDELERKRNEEESRYICPKIVIQLEPLMVLPSYKLTAEQINKKREKIILENEGKPDFNPDLVVVPESAHFGVDRAMVTPVDPKFMQNILKSQKVPIWVTKADLKAQFAPYASDSSTRQERLIKGNRIEETYPFVNINDDRVAFIIFDPSTHDAQFAVHMMKKTVMTKKSADGSTLSETLIFGHSYCTDRDSMSHITQQPRSVQRRVSGANTKSPRALGDSSNPPRSRNEDRRHEQQFRDEPRSRDDRPPRESIKRVAATAVPQHRQAPVNTTKSSRSAPLNSVQTNVFSILGDNN